MTVSEWGSTAAPHRVSGVAPGLRPGRSQMPNTQYIHPAHGGADPRAIAQMRAQASTAAGFPPYPAQGGYPAPQAYGTAPQTHGGAAQPSAARFSAPHPEQAPPPGGAGVLTILGAAVSVALVVGLGLWGYKLAVRDVTGVPVVRALEGPMRIQPEDPGGVVAPHQGLAVNDVAADGVSAGPVDQVVLAPPATALTADDVPAHPEVEVSSAVQRPAIAPVPAPMPSTGGEIDADAAVAEALGLTDLPGQDLPGLDLPAATEAPVETIPDLPAGLSSSPRPRPRPSGFGDLPELTAPVRAVDVSAAVAAPPPARPAPGAETAPAVVLGQEIDPAAVGADTRLVQLGAYKSPEEARAQWSAFAELNPGLFENRNWTIEQSQAGGSPFYRLRAIGFADIDDARAFCAALIAAQGTCVSVID